MKHENLADFISCDLRKDPIHFQWNLILTTPLPPSILAKVGISSSITSRAYQTAPLGCGQHMITALYFLLPAQYSQNGTWQQCQF